MRTIRRILAIVLAPMAAAASSPPLLTGSIEEHFSGSNPVAGSQIVGLSMVPHRGPPDLSRLHILLPGGQATQRVCIHAATRDGLYRASGVLAAPSEARGFVRVGERSRFARELSAYSTSDFAVVATSCERDAVRTLLIAGDGTMTDTLRFQIQTRDAVQAVLSVADVAGRQVSATCRKAQMNATIAFDYECLLPLAGLARRGRSNVTVRIRDVGGEFLTYRATIAWP